MNDKGHKIGAVVVLYNPDMKELGLSIEMLLPQVDMVCLVDNSQAENSHLLNRNDKIKYIPLLENVGIAKAQNVGITYLRENQYDFALFSDQDSRVSDGLVLKLEDAYLSLESNGLSVGVVGTKAINKVTNKAYPPKSKIIQQRTINSLDGGSINVTECYSVISSVSLISLRVLNTVGGFDEELFIDGVDHEWCWRAWHKHGLKSYVVDDAILYHQFGEGDRSLIGKDVEIASYRRMYFQYRNYLWLCRRSYVPKYWKRKNGIKYLVKMFYFPIFVKPRMMYLANIAKGIKDGLKNNKYNNEYRTIDKLST